MSRKTRIGQTQEEHLKKLRRLPHYYQVYVNIEGASDETPDSAPIYRKIYAKFKEHKVGMSTYGFATLPEARNCKSQIEDIADSKGFKAIVTINRVSPP